MPRIIEVPGIGNLEFPDGTPDDEVRSAIEARIAQEKRTLQPPPRHMTPTERVAAQPNFGENLARSGVDFFGSILKGGAGLARHGYEMATSPVETATKMTSAPNLKQTGELVMENLGERYGGGLENALATFYTDPVGTAADVSTVATGLGGMLGRVPMAGRALKTTAALTDPLNVPFKLLEAAAPAKKLDRYARKMYQHTLKPPPSMGTAKIGRAVEAGLTEGIVLDDPLARTAALKDRINTTIDGYLQQARTQGLTVDPKKVVSEIRRSIEEFLPRPEKRANIREISGAGKEFLTERAGMRPARRAYTDVLDEEMPVPGQPGRPPQPIPIEEAQKVKKGYYAAVREQFGEVKTPKVEAYKDIARGLKNEIYDRLAAASGVPVDEIKKLGKREQALIDLEEALGRFVSREMNKNIVSLDTPAAATTAAVLGGPTAGLGTGLATILAKQFLDKDPKLISRLAIALKKRNLSPFPKTRRAATVTASGQRATEER